jgi:hypothetical protein
MAALPLGVFSRTEQRVLQALFKTIADGDGCCVSTLATLARASGTSPTTTRNAIVRAIAIGLLEETKARLLRIRQPRRRASEGSGSQAGRSGNRGTDTALPCTPAAGKPTRALA